MLGPDFEKILKRDMGKRFAGKWKEFGDSRNIFLHFVADFLYSLQEIVVVSKDQQFGIGSGELSPGLRERERERKQWRWKKILKKYRSLAKIIN